MFLYLYPIYIYYLLYTFLMLSTIISTICICHKTFFMIVVFFNRCFLFQSYMENCFKTNICITYIYINTIGYCLDLKITNNAGQIATLSIRISVLYFLSNQSRNQSMIGQRCVLLRNHLLLHCYIYNTSKHEHYLVTNH